MSDLKTKIESMLFAAGRPVKLGELVKSLQTDRTEIKTALLDIQREFLHTGINLVESGEQYQLATNPENAKIVADFLNAEVREKLTEAGLETLAIIVYKQPVSRAEIEAIRGVNSQYILRQLLIRGMIEKAASSQDARRYVYRTTLDFMHHLGLRAISELPDFEELTKSVSLENTAFLTAEPTTKSQTPSEQSQTISSAEPTPAKEKAQTKHPDFAV